MPKSIAIMGAGAIGVEFAYFYNMLGVKVDIIEMQDHILPIEDAECIKHVERSFKKHKIGIHTKTKVLSVKKGKNNVAVEIEKKGKVQTIESDVFAGCRWYTGKH